MDTSPIHRQNFIKRLLIIIVNPLKSGRELLNFDDLQFIITWNNGKSVSMSTNVVWLFPQKKRKMFDGHINARHQVFAHFFFTLCFVLAVVCVLWCGHRIHPKRSVIIRRWAFWFGFRHFNHPPFIIKYYHNSIWCAQHSNRPTIRPEAENFCKRRVMPLFQWL